MNLNEFFFFNEFNNNYLNILLQKISKEKKNIFLLGDFNVDLLAQMNLLTQFLLVCICHISYIELEYKP